MANRRLIRIAAGAALTAAGILLKTDNRALELSIFLAAYLAAGGDILLKAARNILRGQVFDENFLMGVATIGAFAIGEYPEGVAVMLFYKIGELFQGYAVGKSRKSIAALMDIRPDYANVRRGGALEKVSPDEVRVGDVIVIKPGEKIPLDATVTEGASMVDASALTGESAPREVSEGSGILSGCVNINGLLAARVEKEYGESTASKILDLVENAAGKKAKAESFITKFAKYYTPAVVALAALISVVPPLLLQGAGLVPPLLLQGTGLVPPLLLQGAGFGGWAYRGLTFLVISCPCALVVSIPLGFFGGIGAASKKGILVKGGNYLEALAETEIVVFDKTGTLTKGVFEVQEIVASGTGGGMEAGMGGGIEAGVGGGIGAGVGGGTRSNELLELAAYAESYSSHPISASLKKAYGREIDGGRIGDVDEIPGHGVCAAVDGRIVLAGNAKLMKKMGIDMPPCGGGETASSAGTVVHVAADGAYAGQIVIADGLKDDSRRAVAELKKAGVRKAVMLTGDAKSACEKVSRELGLDAAYAELLPGGKVEKLEGLFAQLSPKGKLAFVGDGINDAPVLARADVGIAMGGLGADAAIEAADVVIMTDEPSKIPAAIKISRRTLGIVRQNIFFSLAVKLCVLALSAIGLATMWAGVLADVGVTLAAVLNASRALNAGDA